MLKEQLIVGVAQMKREWNCRRELIERKDAQRRWDRAYQLLIKIAADSLASSMSPKDQTEVTPTADISGDLL